MGTTDNFDVPAKGSFGLADQVPIKDSVTSRGAYSLGSEMLSGLGGVVNTTATTLTVTQALHGNRTVTVSSAAPIAVTLPQATGTGTMYRFQMQVAATATGHTIKVANATDVMQGVSWIFSDNAANAVIAFPTTATSDTITVNGSTLGGLVGDIIEVIDVKTGFFSVRLHVQATGTEATPFSATV